MTDRLHGRLRSLGETFGLTGRALERFVEGRDGPGDAAALGRRLGFTEAEAARFARDVGGGSAPEGGSVLDALAECFRRPPWQMSADGARGWARTRILAVAKEYPGRADLAEQKLWQIVGALRLGSAYMPSAAGSATPSAEASASTSASRAPSASPRREIRDVTEPGRVIGRSR